MSEHTHQHRDRGSRSETQFEGQPEGRQQRDDDRPRPEPIASRKFHVGNKTFFVDAFKNFRGPFLRITEQAGRRSNIQIDVNAIDELITALADVRDELNRQP